MRKMKLQGDPKRAVAYVRVSTEEQSLGPDAQREAIRRYASAHGITVVEWHTDLGLSGSLPAEQRPGLSAAIDSLREVGAGVLVAAKRDRIARDVVVAGMVRRAVEAAGASLVTADLGNEDTPEGALMRGIVDSFAEYERSLIRYRTKSALAVKRERGERVGSIPFGFQLAEDGKHLEENSDEQEVIGLVREMRASGVSYRRIVALLNEGGLPARGNKWHLKTVQRIVGRA